MGRLIGIIFIIFAVLDDDTKAKIKSFFMKIFGNKSDQTPSFPDLQKTVGGKMSGASGSGTVSAAGQAGAGGKTPSYTYTYSNTGADVQDSKATAQSANRNAKANMRQEQYARPVMRHRGGRLKTIAAYGLFGVSAISFWYLLVSVFENIASSTALIEYASLIPNLIFSIICLMAGIWLLYTKKRKIDRENRYEAIINQGYGMIPIDNICSQFPVKYDTCVQELQEMINKGVLPGAYIDYGRRLLVIDPKNSSIEPLIDQNPDAAGSATAGKSKSKRKKKISEQEIDFLSLERLSKQVKDEDIKLKLIRISTTLKTIGQKVKEDPQIGKDPEVETFMEMYLPKTIKLVEDYEEVNSMTGMPQDSELKENILETLDAIDDAATTLWKDIIHSDMIDISSELDALQTKLEMDGYKKGELEPETAEMGGAGGMAGMGGSAAGTPQSNMGMQIGQYDKSGGFTFDGMDLTEEKPAGAHGAAGQTAGAREHARGAAEKAARMDAGKDSAAQKVAEAELKTEEARRRAAEEKERKEDEARRRAAEEQDKRLAEEAARKAEQAEHDAENSARQAQEKDAAMEADLFNLLRAQQEKEREMLK